MRVTISLFLFSEILRKALNTTESRFEGNSFVIRIYLDTLILLDAEN